MRFECSLALTGGKILFVFSLKTKRFGRKAGKWFPKMPKRFAPNPATEFIL